MTILQRFAQLWSESTDDDKTWIKAMIGLEELSALAKMVERLQRENRVLRDEIKAIVSAVDTRKQVG